MIDWTTDDIDRLREYLQTTDYKLIQKLRERLPSMDAKTFEETSLQAKEFKGASDKIKEIETLSEPERKPPIQPDRFVDVSCYL